MQEGMNMFRVKPEHQHHYS